MSEVSVHGRGARPQRVEQAFRRACERQLHQAMRHVEAEARRRAPFRTGLLRRSITSRVEVRGSTIVGAVGTALPYANYLEMGTGLYGPRNRLIVPTRGQALRWPAGGGASLFAGGRRRQGRAGRGFRLSGQQRAGAAGEQAEFVFRRSVKGIRPLRFFRDSILIAHGGVQRELRLIPHVAQKELAR